MQQMRRSFVTIISIFVHILEAQGITQIFTAQLRVPLTREQVHEQRSREGNYNTDDLFSTPAPAPLLSNARSDDSNTSGTHINAASTRKLSQRLALPPSAPVVGVVAEDDEDFYDDIGAHPIKFAFGVFIMLIALPIQWFNERRSAKMDTLITRGAAECVSVDDTGPDPKNRGKLVHVQGRTRATVALVDAQFLDARVEGCLKLQSTVEVFEWYQTTRTWFDGQERRSQPRFDTMWTTTHHDSSRFRKPSPENPRLPRGLPLGTATKVCSRVELDGYIVPTDLVSRARNFEPAVQRLPNLLTCQGLTFAANPIDGYYYARPSMAPAVAARAASASGRMTPVSGLFGDPQVGDIRVRFMCVPQGDATIVAVQCERSGRESFVPYRPIQMSMLPCDADDRDRLVDEGSRPLKELRGGTTGGCCCAGGLSGVCFCPCQVIACVCTSEVITEEIYYSSEALDSKEKPFQRVVPRSQWRVNCYRIAGCILIYLSVAILFGGPLQKLEQSIPQLEIYGSDAAYVLALLVTMAVYTITMALAHIFYRPCATLQWVCVMCLLICAPLAWGGAHHSSSSYLPEPVQPNTVYPR